MSNKGKIKPLETGIWYKSHWAHFFLQNWGAHVRQRRLEGLPETFVQGVGPGLSIELDGLGLRVSCASLARLISLNPKCGDMPSHWQSCFKDNKVCAQSTAPAEDAGPLAGRLRPEPLALETGQREQGDLIEATD